LATGSTPSNVSPAASCDHLARADGSRLADQNEERALKSVLRIVHIADQATANAENHGSMPADQHLKARLITASDEAVQQLPIGRADVRCPKHSSAQLPHDLELGRPVLGRRDVTAIN
jgi:hypothetical protein